MKKFIKTRSGDFIDFDQVIQVSHQAESGMICSYFFMANGERHEIFNSNISNNLDAESARRNLELWCHMKMNEILLNHLNEWFEVKKSLISFDIEEQEELMGIELKEALDKELLARTEVNK